MSEHDHNVDGTTDRNEPLVDGQGHGSQRELSDDDRTRRRQEHNEAVHHGGVAQIGDFDAEAQREEREEREAELVEGAPYNANDPALPTVTEDHLNADVDENDRPVDEIADKQADLPSNESNQG